MIINLFEIKFIINKMRKLKYSNKIIKETITLSEMINTYVKKMNKEYVNNMNKLIEFIARGENLDVNRLKTKYLGLFSSNQETEDIENDDKNENTEISEISEIKVTQNSFSTDINEIYLDKVLIDNSEYWYEKIENGKIYYDNKIVGNYDKLHNIFDINGKKYNQNSLKLV